MSRLEQVRETLNKYGQPHLLRHWEELSESALEKLLTQIEEIDFPLVARLIKNRDHQHSVEPGGADDRAARAEAPEQMVRLPQTDADWQRKKEAAKAGEQLLRDGKVGAILVAGGQGSRLGFDAPKGLFPIGPVSERTLFQILCEQLLARSQAVGVEIPYFIMTSEATHLPTVAFFEQYKYFGLGEENVYFFQQASLPAVEYSSGRILLESKDRVATSPDGHGGILRALEKNGMIGVMKDRGIEHLFYHQVDNPTVTVCDPALLGYHLREDSDLTTVAVAKTGSEEKMGVLATVDGRTEIIEYSDLSPEQAARTQDNGTLVFWAGNTAVHVFRREFFESLLSDDLSLPFHIAHKKVPYLDDSGTVQTPESPNANKFEQFVFDALPHAKVALVVEENRDQMFNPVKNAEGNDSPATCRAALAQQARQMVESAGGTIAEGITVEVSALLWSAPQELASLVSGQVFEEDTVVG
ncbi:MAG: UDPGP type 1 family protein [Planctomycetaceae bacterium]|nr:UDPGP type 1 family protein [Planctomycetaceae bacterium]